MLLGQVELAAWGGVTAYLRFIISNWRLLFFGFALTFFASFGQTYFIALFGAEIRNTFALSHGDFGTVYSIATLSSAATLIWLGRLIDHVDLRLFAGLACLGLAVACLVTANATSVIALTVAVYLLRLMGQGLMSHTAITSMARHFEHVRGRAISFAALGYPCSEAIFPIAVVAVVAAYGWRSGWLMGGLILSIVVVPLLLWLLKGQASHPGAQAEPATGAGGSATRPRQWTRAEVLRDRRFYVFLPAYLAPSFIITGLFFHQVHLASEKGWSLGWLATCFIGYAAAKTVGSLLSGPLVDRFGTFRLLPVYMVPLIAAVVVVILVSHPIGALAYMALAGLANGITFTIIGAFWVEAYGVRHLGSIRALAAALSVMASALSPVSLGLLIDAGATINQILWLCFAYAGLAWALSAVAYRRREDGAAHDFSRPSL